MQNLTKEVLRYLDDQGLSGVSTKTMGANLGIETEDLMECLTMLEDEGLVRMERIEGEVRVFASDGARTLLSTAL